MRKCVCGEFIKRMCRFDVFFYESQIRDAHSGRSDICILRSHNRSTLISIYDQRFDCHCRICLSLSTKQPRELKYVSNV